MSNTATQPKPARRRRLLLIPLLITLGGCGASEAQRQQMARFAASCDECQQSSCIALQDQYTQQRQTAQAWADGIAQFNQGFQQQMQMNRLNNSILSLRR